MLQLHYLFNESIVCICTIKKNGVRNSKFFICVNFENIPNYVSFCTAFKLTSNLADIT